MASLADSYHAGERIMQVRSHVPPEELERKSKFIRGFMPAQHQEFYENQILLYVATRDTAGRLWASALAGSPGFIQARDGTQYEINPLRVVPGDPANFSEGGFIGGLGLELHSRRRNRVNGHIVAADGTRMVVEVEQTVGNCPKYIQTRDVVLDEGKLQNMDRPRITSRGTGPLGDDQCAMIATSVTFYIASGNAGEAGNATPKHRTVGLDMSHRGGLAGFVVPDASGTELTWTEYSGNNIFMTLGNLLSNPACALLFVDYVTGDTLQLTGHATLEFDEDTTSTKVTVRFVPQEWVHICEALPITSKGPIGFSPHNPLPTSGKPDGVPSDSVVGASSMTSPVECVEVIQETHDVKTYILKAAADGTPFRYTAGQYATFDFKGLVASAPSEVINRSWTISSSPSHTSQHGTFSITVKKAGQVSSYLWDTMQAGSVLQLRGVGGQFTPMLLETDAGRASNVLLVAGGIGITPSHSMIPEILRQSSRGVLVSRVTLVYSVRSAADAAFLSEFAQLAESSEGRLKVVVTVTGGEGADAGQKEGPAGVQWRQGRVTSAVLREAVADVDVAGHVAMMCGPTAFMQAVEEQLVELGVNPSNIHQESFSY